MKPTKAAWSGRRGGASHLVGCSRRTVVCLSCLATIGALSACGGSSGHATSTSSSTAGVASVSTTAAAGVGSTSPGSTSPAAQAAVAALRTALKDVADSDPAAACAKLTARGRKLIVGELGGSTRPVSCTQALGNPSTVSLVGSLLVDVSYKVASVGPSTAIVVTMVNGQLTPGGGRNQLVKSGGAWLIDRPAV